jgi:hypothetical protein
MNQRHQQTNHTDVTVTPRRDTASMQTLDTLSIGRPVTRGPFALFPLYTHAGRNIDYVPGPLATANGVITVDEQPGAVVPTLAAHVSGTSPVLLIEGETFVGGLQNRILNVSVLLAPGHQELPVACVEAHRWGSRAGMARSELRAPRRVRRVKNASVANALRSTGVRHADQGAIWEQVDETLAASQADAPTASLHAAFAADFTDESKSIRPVIEELVAVGPLPDQAGVVVAAGGRCLTAELFDCHETLTAYWPTIVLASALDMPSKRAPRPSIADALRFVRRVARAQETSNPGVSLGRERHFIDAKVVAQALEYDGSLVHLSVLAA